MRTYDAAGNTTKIGSGSKDPALVYNDAKLLLDLRCRYLMRIGGLIKKAGPGIRRGR